MNNAKFLSTVLIFFGVALPLWLIILPAVRSYEAAAEGIIIPFWEPVSPTSVLTETEDLFYPGQLESFPFADLINQAGLRPKIPDHFFLTIDKFKIREASVAAEIDLDQTRAAEDALEKSLVQEKGSARPGETGNVIIFGHSALPAFFRAGNYETIFARLPELIYGDEIVLKSDGNDYVYTVREKRIVAAETDLLNLKLVSGQNLILVTCFPPGLTTERLLVIARRIPPE